MGENDGPIDASVQFTQGVLGQVNRILEEAARTDESGDWGLNGWIRLGHNLIDLQIKTSASLLQMGLAGPWWLHPVTGEVPLSAEITVPPADYPRAIWILESFRRTAAVDTTIPDRAISFVPPVLAPGETTFQIALSDDEYAGATYRGTVAFRPTGGSRRASDQPPVPITVGL